MVPESSQPLATLTSNILDSDEEWKHVSVQGLVKGKERGNMSISKTRVLSPLIVLMDLMDRVMMSRVALLVQERRAYTGLKHLSLCGQRVFSHRVSPSRWLNNWT